MLAKYYRCVHMYLVISEVIVQRVLQFAQRLLFLLFSSFLPILEDTKGGRQLTDIIKLPHFIRIPVFAEHYDSCY